MEGTWCGPDVPRGVIEVRDRQGQWVGITRNVARGGLPRLKKTCCLFQLCISCFFSMRHRGHCSNYVLFDSLPAAHRLRW